LESRQLSEKTTTGRLVSAIAGIILIISLFLKWYGAPDQVNEFAQAAGVGNIGANAFQATDLGGIFLLITGVIAIIPAALDIFDLEIARPRDPRAWCDWRPLGLAAHRRHARRRRNQPLAEVRNLHQLALCDWSRCRRLLAKG
jgi:hypothetical protein